MKRDKVKDKNNEQQEFQHSFTEECKPTSPEVVTENGLAIRCGGCESLVPVLEVYYKPVEVCQHGAPTKVMGLCFQCVILLEFASGGIMMHPVSNSDMNEIEEVLKAQDNKRSRHLH